jgi:hypothetical protein
MVSLGTFVQSNVVIAELKDFKKIRLFETVTLKYITTLPKPHPLGIDVAYSVGTR